MNSFIVVAAGLLAATKVEGNADQFLGGPLEISRRFDVSAVGRAE
jgi:hypothetical protein